MGQTGRQAEALTMLDELLGQLQPAAGELADYAVEVFLLLRALGRDTDVLRLSMAPATRWMELVEMLIGGDVRLQRTCAMSSECCLRARSFAFMRLESWSARDVRRRPERHWTRRSRSGDRWGRLG
jgi:hypothetical protein